MDKLCLVVVANEFAALNDNRKDNFGTFKENDLKMSWWHSTVACVPMWCLQTDISIGSFRFEIFPGEYAPGPP